MTRRDSLTCNLYSRPIRRRLHLLSRCKHIDFFFRFPLASSAFFLPPPPTFLPEPLLISQTCPCCPILVCNYHTSPHNKSLAHISSYTLLEKSIKESMFHGSQFVLNILLFLFYLSLLLYIPSILLSRYITRCFLEKGKIIDYHFFN